MVGYLNCGFVDRDNPVFLRLRNSFLFDAEKYIKIEASKIVDVIMNGGEAGNTARTEYARKEGKSRELFVGQQQGPRVP